MSTYLRDVKNNVVEGIGLALAVYTGDQATPTAVDMVNGDGLCAIQVVLGTIHTDSSGAITVEESDDNSTFTSVTLSNTLTYTGTSDNTILRAYFQRSKRYVRTPTTVLGSTKSAGIAVILSEQKKFVY